MKNNKPTHLISFVVFDQAQLLDIAGPLDVFKEANQYLLTHGDDVLYKIDLIHCDKANIETSGGVQLMAHHHFSHYRRVPDTLLVSGGGGVHGQIENNNLLRFIQRNAKKAKRTASVCTGAFLLAAAGLLDGRKASTHWRYTEHFRQRYPRVDLQPDAIFIEDNGVYTSAGVSAGIDMALALVEEDLGREVALAVARELVVYLQRPGGQSQFSDLLQQQCSTDDRFRHLDEWLRVNLAKVITVQDMAEVCSIGERHFARLFVQRQGLTPAKYLEQMRINQARVLMEKGTLNLKAICQLCGFRTHEHLRRSFQRQFQVNPKDYMARF